MILRSATPKDTQIHGTSAIGSFVELRSEDHAINSASKPWLARIAGRRQVEGEEGDTDRLEEVECEWVWHPSEAMKDFDLMDQQLYDPTVYGSREVFLGQGTGEGGRDWNSVDSIKYRVYVLPLETYKQVAAAGYQMHLSPNGNVNLPPYGTTPMSDSSHEESHGSSSSVVTTVEPGRLWYYRQALYIDENNVKSLHPPTLPLVISRPNPEYHAWCHQQGRSLLISVSPDSSNTISTSSSDIPSSSIVPPPRSILVPENPERMYFYCSGCQRRFETRQGDCIDPSLLHENKFARKSHITLDDVVITCPLCKETKSIQSHESLGSGPPPSKKARTGSTTSGSLVSGYDLWLNAPTPTVTTPATGGLEEDRENAKELRRENQRKQGRYERVKMIFTKSIQEVIDAGGGDSLLYKDPQGLADLFFDRFDVYSTGNQLNTKMEHQKLHEIFQNIKRENNIDLRRRIVTGDMTIDELIAADVKDLAPESLKKKREAEQKKYFQQQVLLSVGPESLRVIRKTHKGLEVVDDENQARALSAKDRKAGPEDIESEGVAASLSIPDDVSSSSSTTSLSVAIPSVEGIIAETFQGRRDRGPPDRDLVDLPFPLAREWGASKRLYQDHQLTTAPEFLGLPTRAQSKDLVLTKLKAIHMNEKIVAEITAYADTSAYGPHGITAASTSA